MLSPQKNLVKVLEQWIETYKNADLQKMMLFYGNDSTKYNCFHFGTGKDEVLKSHDELKEQFTRDWSQSDKRDLKIVNLECSLLSPTSAFIASILSPKIESQGEVLKLPDLRVSIVLVLEGDQWKIVHSHASWPYLEQSEGHSFPN